MTATNDAIKDMVTGGLLKGAERKADNLRPVRTILGNTRRIIVSQVLLPSLKTIKRKESRGERYLTRQEFFSLINDQEKSDDKGLVPPQLSRVLNELGQTLGSFGKTLAGAFGGSKKEAEDEKEAADAEKKPEQKPVPEEAAEDTEEAQRFLECQETFWAALESMLEIDPEKGIAIADLVALCNNCSVSPVATREQREIIIRELETKRLNEVVTRNDFIVMLRKWSEKPENAALNELDFEPYSLYVFPDMTMQVRVLRHLVYKTGSPSEHHAFASSFAKTKTVQAKDMTEFLWYLPFMMIYIIIAMSGKGLNPRAYHGHNINKIFQDVVYGSDFNKGCSRTYDSSFALQSSTCSDDKIVFKDIESPPDAYTFLADKLVPSLWPAAGERPGNQTFGALRVVGGLKMRALRVKRQAESNEAKQEFFGTTNITVFSYPKFSSDNQDQSEYTKMKGAMPHVLMPWDGSTWGSCDQLNGSGTILGDAKNYPCDGHAIVIPFNTSLAQAQEVIYRMEGLNFLDEATRAITIEMFFFHPVTTMMLQERMVIEFHPGGGVTTGKTSRPFQFYTFASNKSGVEVLYYFFVIYLFMLIIRMIYRTAFGVTLNKKLGRKWLVLDIVQYSIFFAHFILRVIWMSRGEPEDPMWQLDHYPHEYELTAWYFTTLLNLDSFNLVLIILTAFRFTKYIPGLDVVLNTLQRSLYDGAAIAFITCGVMVSFVLCAHAVYGTTLFGYHTVGYALESLGVSFLGEFDFWPLHEEHPTFSFIFFFVFQIIIVAVLLNMIIAVFADAFGAEQEESFDTRNANAILENNTFNVINRTTPATVIYHTYLFQTIRAKFRRLYCFIRRRPADIFEYDTYHMQLMMDVRRLLIPLFILNKEGEIDDYEVDWRNRVISASNLLQLVDSSLKAPMFLPPAKIDTRQGTSIYEYFEDIFGWYDYTLVMAFYVLIPQTKFHIPGDYSLLEAAQTHRRWEIKAERKTLRGDEIDEVDLRVHATLEERKQLSAAAGNEITASIETNPQGPVSPTVEWVNTMDHGTRRTLLALVSYATEEECKRVLTREIFDDLVKRSDVFGEKRYFDGWQFFCMLELDVSPDLEIEELHKLMHAEFAQQALAFNWNYDLVEKLEEHLFHKVFPEGRTESPAPGGDNESVSNTSFDRSLGNKGGRSMIMEIKQEEQAEKLRFSTEEFKEAWKASTNFEPSDATMHRVNSIYPNGKIDMVNFLLHCRGNPRAHHHRSFGYQFAADQLQGSQFLLWLVFYIPFFALIVFFLLYGYELGDSIHVTRTMRASFAASDATNLDDVKTYLRSSVNAFWSKDANGLFERSNYFVGAVRIRQKRVASEPAARCKRNFKYYIGDFDQQAIAFPSYINGNTESRAEYDSRIRNDYGDLFAAQCYGAFDFGLQEDEGSIASNLTSLSSAVQFAFQYQTEGNASAFDTIEAHDAVFGRGGYSLILPFSLSRADAQSWLNEALNNNWIDDKTRMIVVEFFSFNLNLRLFGRMRFGYEITGAGSIYPIDEIAVFGAETISEGFFIAFVVIFIILLVIYFIIFLIGWGQGIQLRRHYFGDNFVTATIMGLFSKWTLPCDMLIIATLATSWIMRAVNAAESSIDTITNNDSYPSNLETIASTSITIRQIEGINIFFTFLRVLYFFKFNRRIALLFDTFAAASKDLASIAALFVLSLFAFALGGYVLFGYTVEVYFNFQRAFYDLFITATGGNPSYFDLAEARPQAAAIFNLFFVIVSVYILYNMVIAVLTGAFSEVKDEIYDDSVARSVIKQEKGSAWFPSVSTKQAIKDALRHNVVSNELRYIVNLIKHKGRPPFWVTNENPRKLWSNLTHWYGELDTGLPAEALLSGYEILRFVHFSFEDVEAYEEIRQRNASLAQSRKSEAGAENPAAVADESPLPNNDTEVKDFDESAENNKSTEVKSPGPKSPTGEEGLTSVVANAVGEVARRVPGVRRRSTQKQEEIEDDSIRMAHKIESGEYEADDERKKRAGVERKVMIDMGKKLRTYSSRRLPMWEEYIFYIFKEEKEEVLRYLIQAPCRLTGVPEHYMWMAALESFHYFNSERETYNVDVTSRLEDIYALLPDVNEMKMLADVKKPFDSRSVSMEHNPVVAAGEAAVAAASGAAESAGEAAKETVTSVMTGIANAADAAANLNPFAPPKREEDDE